MKKKKVLVVDDDKKSRYLVSFLLEKESFEVIMATNGLEGIEAARKQQVDLIIMDVKMPKMDGYETTKRIRRLEKYKSIPIIALTSYAMTEDKERALKAGCTGYIPKPITSETFISEIKKFLEVKDEKGNSS
ncbi:two-component system response regulator [Candidatus Atribacteria bacterium 4572_76]|nr:MAG: two-component system response regulator [Candidatus Atribacteria bacterium 4572_76]